MAEPTDERSQFELPPPRRWGSRTVRAIRMPLLLALIVVALGRCGVAERLFYHPIREATPPPTWLHPQAEAFWVESTDGTRLRAWFVPGGGPGGDRYGDWDGDWDEEWDDRSRPTIVHVHGNAGNMNYHLAFTAHLAEHGFNLVLFDYRGFGESDGSARRRADLIADTRSVLRAVVGRDDVDPALLGVFGQSLGGAVAISAIVAEHDDPDGVRVHALVLESPFASWREIAANALGGDPPLAPARWFASLMIGDDHSPLVAAPHLVVPTLIVHGDADRIVPPSHGRRLAEAIPGARLEIYRGGTHNTLIDTHAEMGPAVRAFYREALLP